jgi:hypothetical protein
LRPFRTRPAVRALVVVLASLLLSGCIPPGQAAEDAPTPRLEGRQLSGTAPQGGTGAEGPEGGTLSASIPARDARGEPVPGLPRPPGSVRTGYSERETEGLVLVRAAYLTRARPAAVRGFYRGVFGAEGWQVANVEYSGDGWHFLVLRGDQEAQVKVLPREGGSSEVELDLSGAGSGGAQNSPASAGGSKR